MEWKAQYFIGERLLSPIFGLVPLWNMKDMSPPTHLNLSVEWKARYSFGNDFWNPYLDWCPSKTRRIWANRLILILLSVNHVTSRHSLVSGKVSIELQPTWPRFDVEFKEMPIAGLRRPPFTESSIDRWSEKLYISSKTTIETHIWTCAPLKHEKYEPTDSF